MENYYSSDHLARHETLEIHELTAFQSIGLSELIKSPISLDSNREIGLSLLHNRA